VRKAVFIDLQNIVTNSSTKTL